MKNILGQTENLTLYNEKMKRCYSFVIHKYGLITEHTYNENGNVLTFKSSNGYSSESTYDSNGNLLTYKDSDGVSRGFDIPEFTMEELVEKLGNFKIKK